MLKIILATLVSFSVVAFANEGTETAPTAPTGTEMPKADKKEMPAKPAAHKGKHEKAKKHE